MASEHINQDKSFQNKTNEDYINGDVQFSVGEQNGTIRQQFWATIYKECPMCKKYTVIYQCLGQESANDVRNLQWDKTTRKLPDKHEYSSYTSFYHDEEGLEPENFETQYWMQ
ncbi:unnamed protein product [Rotaria sordida]|uniref:Uncharacterized protein n=1 Tax=Rotaria sordida TaxID=392033 RepID=A0A815NES9_9BILA|nr:unnamed protein product [Rotaria sordida]